MKTKLLIILYSIFSSLLLGEEIFYKELVDKSMSLTQDNVVYDPTYFKLDYPNGDAPADRGVCTDVIVRAYRKMGIDLQKEVHEDMKKNFNEYPKNWGLKGPDKNIDHRRVPNLMVYFKRFGETKKITDNPDDYISGDIVCWNLAGGLKHIGIVVNTKSTDGKRPMIVHNIGAGQVEEDCLFSFKIIGHYRYNKSKAEASH